MDKAIDHNSAMLGSYGCSMPVQVVIWLNHPVIIMWALFYLCRSVSFSINLSLYFTSNWFKEKFSLSRLGINFWNYASTISQY